MVIQETISPGTTMGGFEIEKVLGKGGMGVVYKAHESSLNRKVALKVLSHMLSVDTEFITRFKKEAQVIAALNHRNIVSILSFGQDLGHYYFAMEYIKGRDLAQILEEKRIIPLEEALLITRQVADALSEAGKKGVVHRDLKPANIMIDEMNRTLVTDFGVARVESANDNLTKTGMFLGSPQYASPEQAEGRHIDPRSDIYALGAVLYRMLSGTPPTTADSPLAVVVKIISETVTPIEQVNSSVPAPICALIGKMMAKDLEQRYQSAEEVIVAIDNCLQFLKTGEAREEKETVLVPPRPPAPVPENGSNLWWPWGATGVGVLLLILFIWGGNSYFSEKAIEDAQQQTSVKDGDTPSIDTRQASTTPAETENFQGGKDADSKKNILAVASQPAAVDIPPLTNILSPEIMAQPEDILNTSETVSQPIFTDKEVQMPEQPTILLIASGPEEMVMFLQSHLETTLIGSNLQVLSPAEIPILHKKMQIGELPVNWYNIRQFIPDGRANILVLAKIQKAGSTLLKFYGSSQEQISATFSVKIMDMNTGTMVEPSINGMVKYTALNMQDEFQDTLSTKVNKMGDSIQGYWQKKIQEAKHTKPVSPTKTKQRSARNA